MSVKIRQMTNNEFANFHRWSMEQHTKELMEELHISQEEASKTAIAELSQMLPNGFNTEHNDLMTIVAEDKNVGYIWTVYEETEGRQQLFVCDFAIWESERRKGYGAAALGITEKNAAQAGCQEIVLFVRDDNAAARALYQKSGYHVLRQKGYGKYMIKQLSC